ncbi:MAG TPA: pitrilysin family protein, partial [Fimbriimonadaceae bacterium]|nr:pitrilysin family protein [Fimbriimonadaceae bacterium]
GWNNADTTEDRTDFYDVGPSNLLPTLLWLEADRLETLGKNMTQKKLDLQRDVVKNERRQNTENTPYGRAYEALNGLMFPPGHPYHTSVIGSMEDLDNASVKDVQDFFATYYVPNNATMVVAGDFAPADVKAQVAKLFGTLPRANDVPRKFVPPAILTGVKRLTFIDDVRAAKVILAWHAPAIYHDGDAELNLAASILSDGVNSRLYQRLVVKDKLASDVSCSVDDRLLESLFLIDATALPGAPLDKLEHAIRDELARLTAGGPTKEELRRQVAKAQFHILSGLQGIQQTADQLNEFDYFMGKPDGFSTLLKAYQAVTPDSVKDWMISAIDPSRCLDLRVIPQAQASSGANPRDGRPDLGAAKGFAAPPPATFRLSNGLKVEYWQRPNVPLMAVSLRTSNGADADPAGKGGLASFTAQMLGQGAGKLSAKEFQNALDALGAQYSAVGGKRSITVNLSVTAANFAPALQLYADTLLRPRFDAAELARIKRVTLAAIEQEDADPASIMGRVVNRAFFGVGHPYSGPNEGTKASVSTFTAEDLKLEKLRLIDSGNSTLYVAGALPVATAKKLIAEALGTMRGLEEWLRPDYGQPESKPARVLVVDRPGAVQTVVRFMFPAPTFASPDRHALESFATALGGTFTSRLNHNLREDKGYTYGAFARYVCTPRLGYFDAGADVRTEVTGVSLKEFLAEFARISTGDVTAEEAKKVGRSRRQEMVNGLERLEGLLGTASAMDEDGQKFAEFGRELAEGSSVTADQINALAKRALPMDHMLLVLVGDKAQILKQLEGLGLPSPEVVKP